MKYVYADHHTERTRLRFEMEASDNSTTQGVDTHPHDPPRISFDPTTRQYETQDAIEQPRYNHPMQLLNERYSITRELGTGQQARTVLAVDRETHREVAIKVLALKHAENWKAVELFEREAQTLQSLHHPGIPDYYDTFQEQSDGDLYIYIVQEYIPGQNARDFLRTQGRWDEDTTRNALRELLAILETLHKRIPPVVHRDIKPSNLMLRPDGRLALIDFGGVQNTYQNAVGGSTVIGTPGYMPLEQMVGQATPASDVYSLGVTLCAMLTGVDPSDVGLQRNRLQYDMHLPESSTLTPILLKMIEPNLEDRFESANAVLEALENEHETTHNSLHNLSRLPTTEVQKHLFTSRSLDDVESLRSTQRHAIETWNKKSSLTQSKDLLWGKAYIRPAPDKLHEYAEVAKSFGFRARHEVTWDLVPYIVKSHMLLGPEGFIHFEDRGSFPYSFVFRTFFTDGSLVETTLSEASKPWPKDPQDLFKHLWDHHKTEIQRRVIENNSTPIFGLEPRQSAAWSFRKKTKNNTFGESFFGDRMLWIIMGFFLPLAYYFVRLPSLLKLRKQPNTQTFSYKDPLPLAVRERPPSKETAPHTHDEHIHAVEPV